MKTAIEKGSILEQYDRLWIIHEVYPSEDIVEVMSLKPNDRGFHRVLRYSTKSLCRSFRGSFYTKGPTLEIKRPNFNVEDLLA